MKNNLTPTQVIIFIVMITLSIGIYLFKDKLFQPNKVDKVQVSTFHATDAVIVSFETKEGAGLQWNIQYKDPSGNLLTATIKAQQSLGVQIGDSIMVFVDPKNPQTVWGKRDYEDAIQ